MNTPSHTEALKNLAQEIQTAAGDQDKIDLAVGNYYFDLFSKVGEALGKRNPDLVFETLASETRREIALFTTNPLKDQSVDLHFKRLSVFATHPKAPGTIKVFNGLAPSDFLEMRLKPEIEIKVEPPVKLVNILQPEVIAAIDRAIGVDLNAPPPRSGAIRQGKKDAKPSL